MPDDQEVATENLREAIHEEVEREGGTFLKRIALTTAIPAAFAAVAALTRARSMWIGSMRIGLGGIALFVIYFFA